MAPSIDQTTIPEDLQSDQLVVSPGLSFNERRHLGIINIINNNYYNIINNNYYNIVFFVINNQARRRVVGIAQTG